MLQRVASLVTCEMPSVQIQMLSSSDVDYYLMWEEQSKIESSTVCLFGQGTRTTPGTVFDFSFLLTEPSHLGDHR